MRSLVVLAVVAFATMGPASAVPLGQKQGEMKWSPGNPVAARTVSFSIWASDPNGVITAVQVDFGDGASSLIQPSQSISRQVMSCIAGDRFNGALRHVFAHAGTYVAQLTVASSPCPGLLSDPDYIANFTVTVT